MRSKIEEPQEIQINTEFRAHDSGSSRLWLLDFIRQIGLFLVLSVHLYQFRLAVFPDLFRPFLWLITDGDIGLWMFFVVSGYVISDTTSKRFGSLKDISASDFYAFRAARLLPLFLVAVAFGIICTKIPELRSNPKYNDVFDYGGRTGVFWLALFTGTFNWLRFFLNRFYGLHWDIYWSLAVEEQFYGFFPWLLKLNKSKWILVSLLIIAPVGRFFIESSRHGMFRNMSSFCALDLLSTGVLLFLFLHRFAKPIRSKQFVCHTLLSCGALIVVYTMMQPRTFVFAVFGPSAIAAGLFIFLLGGLNIPWIQKLPNWLVLGGKISYGAYLLHPSMLFFLTPFLLGKGFLEAFLIAYSGTVLAAWLSFRLFEQPLNKAIRRASKAILHPVEIRSKVG